MADVGARAAKAPDDRVSRLNCALDGEPAGRRAFAKASRAWLDRGPNRRNRVSLGGKPHGAIRGDSDRLRPTASRRHSYIWHRSSSVQAGHIDYSDRLYHRRGPGRAWSRREPCSTRQQRHRPLGYVLSFATMVTVVATALALVVLLVMIIGRSI